MNNSASTPQAIDTSQVRQVPGLRFRGFEGVSDYATIASLTQACWIEDGVDFAITEQDVALRFENPVNFEPAKDTLFVEADGKTIGYLEVTWREESEDPFVYWFRIHLLPAWRGKGLESIMLDHAERRLRKIAEQHPKDKPRWFSCRTADSEQYKESRLLSAGYKPVRYFFDMLHRNLGELPKAAMPPGLEVRPAAPEHYRAIWHALGEAFRDHWGYYPVVEADYRQWIQNRRFQPELWKVAWDGDQVAGVVINMIDSEENHRFGRQRGRVDDLGVRRPWRRRGLARALLIQSLHEFHRRGLAEVALGVDTENLTGALRLYESVGFIAEKRFTTLRKPLYG